MSHLEEVRKAVEDSPTAATYRQLAARLATIPSGTVGGCLFELVKQKKIRSLPRPDGKRGLVYFVDPAQAQGQIPPDPVKHRRHRRTPQSGVLITIAIGKNRTESVTIDEARLIFRQLKSLFDNGTH